MNADKPIKHPVLVEGTNAEDTVEHEPSKAQGHSEMTTTPPATKPELVTPAPEPAPQHPPTTDPIVVQLKALFPGTSEEVIEAVVAAHGGSAERATDSLLSMSDPNFKMDTQSSSLMESDAQMAQRLAAEDEQHRQIQQQQHQQQRRQRSSGQSSQPTLSTPPASLSTQHPHVGSPQPLTYQPYVPKRRTTQPGGGNANHPPMEYVPSTTTTAMTDSSAGTMNQRPKDELDQLADGLSKLAEEGKKTFGTFFNKVKGQLNKIDHSSIGSGSGSGDTSMRSVESDSLPPVPPLEEKKESSSSSTSSSSPSKWSTPEPLPRPSKFGSSSSSNSPPSALSSATTTTTATTTTRSGSSRSASAGGPPIGITPSTAAVQQPLSSTMTQKPITLSSSHGVDGVSAIGAAGGNSQDSKKDFSKIGLLPRQPISLLNPAGGGGGGLAPSSTTVPSSASSSSTHLQGKGGGGGGRKGVEHEEGVVDDDDDESEDLEYVRSPFDDDDD